MRDSRGEGVAPHDLWSGSMMAQSSRDPYWKAALSAEILATPAQKYHIVEICTRCHSPMSPVAQISDDSHTLEFMQPGVSNQELATDGVSCTVCHRISDENLGTSESFTGGFVLNSKNEIYGPHSDPFARPMQMHVGYTPKRGDHIMKSALCATCHTVITESFDSAGKETHQVLHEQAPYLEWQNSSFNDESETNRSTGRSCQSCHMPQTDSTDATIATRIAHNPGGRDFPFLASRSPFGQHTFAGGNLFMTRLHRDYRKELGIQATVEAFDRVIRASKHLLTKQTANISIERSIRKEATVSIPVRITNLSGHKLPTAYPSRRLWIEFTVRNKANELVFASGLADASGEIIDATGTVLASEKADGPIQPHFDVIRRNTDVQIYETIMQDASGDATFFLLRGSEFQKDNRLLPQGWQSSDRRFDSIQPRGIKDDSNFRGGVDTTHYELELPPGMYRIEARLLFQSLSARYMEELFRINSPEIEVFEAMYRKMDLAPEVLDSAITETVL